MAYSVGENMGKVNIEVVRGTEEKKEVYIIYIYIYIPVVQSRN